MLSFNNKKTVLYIFQKFQKQENFQEGKYKNQNSVIFDTAELAMLAGFKKHKNIDHYSEEVRK